MPKLLRTILRAFVGLCFIGGVLGLGYYAAVKPPPVQSGPGGPGGPGGGGGRGGGGGMGKGGGGGGDFPTPVLVALTRSADVPVTIDGVGTAKPRALVTVKPQVDGRILSLNFKEGQEVKKGDIIARIDPSTYRAALDQAEAKRALTEAQLTNAKRDYERFTRLQGVVAEKTVDTQKALVAQLTAQLKSDDAAISNARTILEYTNVTAPMAGRTGMRMVDEGNIVRSGDAGLVTITELTPIAVQFTLPQQQLAAINRAMASGTVSIEALDQDGKTVLDRGTLTVVDSQVEQTTGTVKMKAELPNAKQQLWPGQFVNVRVTLETLKGVVVVPTQAVQRGPQGTFVYLTKPDQTATIRSITIRQQTDAETVVSSGLAANETVITSGFNRLKEGQRIFISAAPAATGAAPGGGPPAVAGPSASGGERKGGEGRGEGRRKREGGGPSADGAPGGGGDGKGEGRGEGRRKREAADGAAPKPATQ